jgi:putative ABC transport system ATP-binding protein
MMELIDVTKVYQRGRRSGRNGAGALTVPASRGVSLLIEASEFVSIMGRSGSGKSTLRHLLGALDRPTSGRALFQDKDLQAMSDKERSRLRRNRIGFVFQDLRKDSGSPVATALTSENCTGCRRSRASRAGWCA